MKKPKGIKFPIESPEVAADRRKRNQEKIHIALELGIDITKFDGTNDIIFKNKAERIQYERDTITLTSLLNSGKPIPQDLRERLLKIKSIKDKMSIG